MDKEQYVVVRFENNSTGLEPNDQDVEGYLGAKPAAMLNGGMESTLTAETAELDRQDILEIRGDSTILGVAPALPVELVAPVTKPAEDQVAEPIEGSTWGVYVTGAVYSPYTGKDVVVAVLDTGIDSTHEAFSGIAIIEQDFTGEGNGDENGHGTHVAGTIFGQPCTSIRFGVAPGVRRALIAKVLGSKGGGSSDQIFRAIQWAIDQGAMVINMSLRLDFPGYVQRLVANGWPIQLATSRALQAHRDNIRLFDAVMSVYKRRASIAHQSAILVAAAGNESQRDVKPDFVIDVAPPAGAEGIISVGAVSTPGAPHKDLTVAPFSNANPLVCGPGVGILSAIAGGGYSYLSGTSMASPHVTGVAALWIEWQIKKMGRIDFNSIGHRLTGSASSVRLQMPDDVSSIGLGLVQAPTG